MSEVFSFRLDPNNPREALAIEVIQAWQGKGFSLRFLVVEALAKLSQDVGTPYEEQVEKMNEKLDNLLDLLRSTRESHAEGPLTIKTKERSNDLSAHFLTSIKVASKPGIQIE